MSGWKQWTIGEVVEAADFQSFVQDQTVQNYADSAARTTALGTAVAEGMVSYLQDTNQLEVYDGSDWVSTTGDITAVTAGTALTGGGTAGSVTLDVDESALFTGGTSGYTALSAGTAGLSYQPVSHNYIINGAFDIWQRGTSFTPTSGVAYNADRWAFFSATYPISVTVSQETFTPADITASGFGDAATYARVTATTIGSSTFLRLVQRVEDVRTLAGQNAILSFWARSNNATSVAIQTGQNFGSGGSAGVFATTATQSLTSSWQRFTFSLSPASVSGKTIGAGSNLEVGIQATGGLVDGTTFDLWGVQLEAGSIATPFKRNAPSLQGELAACQRYYQLVADYDSDNKLLGSAYYVNSTQLRVQVHLVTEMRANPSIEIVSGTNYYAMLSNVRDDVDDFFVALPGARNIQLINTTDASGTAGNAGSVYTDVSGGKLAFSAEL